MRGVPLVVACVGICRGGLQEPPGLAAGGPDGQGVTDVVAVRWFGVAEGVPHVAEQVVRAGRGGQDGGEGRDLGEDRGRW